MDVFFSKLSEVSTIEAFVFSLNILAPSYTLEFSDGKLIAKLENETSKQKKKKAKLELNFWHFI